MTTLRAARAALELRRNVAALGIELRIGINTGEVVAEEGETLITGDAVNVAARLEQGASAGEILLGDATYRFARDALSAVTVAPLNAKGKSQPARGLTAPRRPRRRSGVHAQDRRAIRRPRR